MNDRDLFKQALESIDWLRHHLTKHHGCLHMNPTASGIPAWLNKNEAALRERLSQQEQEPVAWGMLDINGRIYDCISVEEYAQAEGDYNVPLYRLFDNG